MLSNWHVFQGTTGVLGDRIVQPGRFDDNRVGENGCGRLVRSFLGLAGDCAIASLEGRGAEETILELDVPVRRLGDPELGDRVVKSGRTTGVTYGVVTRLHTITRLELRPGHHRADRRVRDRPGRGAARRRRRDLHGRRLRLGLDGAGRRRRAERHDARAALRRRGRGSRRRARARLLRIVGVQQARDLAAARARHQRAHRRDPGVGGGYDANFLPGHELPVPVGNAAVDADYAPLAARRGPDPASHALLARDECVAALLPLGGVERGRQRAAAALAQRDRVQARPGLPRGVPGRRRPVRQQPPGSRPHRPPLRPVVGPARGGPAREHGLVPVHEHRARSSTTSTSPSSTGSGASSRMPSTRA